MDNNVENAEFQHGDHGINISLVIEEKGSFGSACHISTCLILTFLSLGVMFSRVWQGVHSIPQVFAGALFGLCSSMITLFYLKKQLSEFCMKILQNDYHNGRERTRFITCWSIGIVMTNLLSIAFWALSK